MTRRCVGCGRHAATVLFLHRTGGLCARCAAGGIRYPDDPHLAWLSLVERVYNRTRARRGRRDHGLRSRDP